MTSQQRESLSRGELELHQDYPSGLVHLAAHRGSARILRVFVRFRRTGPPHRAGRQHRQKRANSP